MPLHRSLQVVGLLAGAVTPHLYDYMTDKFATYVARRLLCVLAGRSVMPPDKKQQQAAAAAAAARQAQQQEAAEGGGGPIKVRGCVGWGGRICRSPCGPAHGIMLVRGAVPFGLCPRAAARQQPATHLLAERGDVFVFPPNHA